MKRLLIIIVVLLTALCSCKDDFDEWGYVNFYIEPDNTQYYNLNDGSRGWEYFEGGNRGVIVFRNSHYDFMAYERSCTQKGCKGRLEVDTQTNVIVRCPQCGTEWLSVDGSPLPNDKIKGNIRMLYSYCSYYDGWKLYVSNCAR